MIIAALVGFLFGFIGSMPVAGPIAALVFARAIDDRITSGISIAGGAAVAEAGYAFLAFYGISALLGEYPWVVPISQAIAALVLIALGIIFARRRVDHDAPPAHVRDSIGGSALLGFTITALNPTFVATWTAAAATLAGTGLVKFTPGLALPFALGACIGIVGWFALLLYLVHRFKGRFTRRTLNRIVQVMGYALLALSLWFVYSFARWLITR